MMEKHTTTFSNAVLQQQLALPSSAGAAVSARLQPGDVGGAQSAVGLQSVEFDFI